jgi:hypothetical protein
MRSSVRRRWLTLAAGTSLFIAPAGMVVAQVEQPAAGAASPLPAEPQTPEQLFDAVLLTLQLNRPDVARRYLEAFVAAAPGDDYLLELRNRYGTATFMQLARTKELQPASQELLDRVRQAAQSRMADAAVIDRLIDQLTGTAREREQALMELKHLREYSVPHLFRRVVDEQRPISEPLAVSTMALMGDHAVMPLIGALPGPSGFGGWRPTPLGASAGRTQNSHCGGRRSPR